MRDCGFQAGQGVTEPLERGEGKGKRVEKHRREIEKNSAPSTCPSMRDGVRSSYIYAIHYVFG